MGEKSKILKDKMVRKYRLVILTDDSFEEKFAFKLNRLNVFVFLGVFSVFLILLTVGLIVSTPLKEYIPGFQSVAVKKQALQMNMRLDSLQKNMQSLESFTESLKPVLIGGSAVEMIKLPYKNRKGESSVYQIGIKNNDTVVFELNALQTQLAEKDRIIKRLTTNKGNATIIKVGNADEYILELTPEEIKMLGNSKRDSLFRAKVDREDSYGISSNSNKSSLVFVNPLHGNIKKGFNFYLKHYGISIVAAKDQPVKAIASGVVLTSDWSLANGYQLVVLHQNNFISVYKQANKTFVKKGDKVLSGQVIANVGYVVPGLKTQPFLSFELWKDGYPLNPVKYIKF